MKKIKKVSIFTVLKVGFFGTISGSIFFSPLPSLVALILSPIYFFLKSKRVPKVVFYAFLFYFISLVSIVLYDPEGLLKFDFYRRDGNFIISFAPLLVFPFLRKKFDVERLFYHYLIFSVVVYYFLYLFLFEKNTDFTGLFRAHNAAGGFLSILVSLSFMFFWNKRKYINLILFSLSFFLLIKTGSRGSLLGFLAGLTFYFFWKKRKMFYTKIMIFGIALVQVVILAYSYPAYKKHNLALDNNINRYIATNLNKSGSGREANIYLRTHNNWPRGLELFLNSPILGTGFGSVNDVPFDLEGVKGVFSFNTQPEKEYNSAHAHHTYLNILGEQGVLGFFIFILLLRSIYQFLKRHNQNEVVQSFLIMSFFNLIIMSFTEHRLVSPSNALPFIIPFCIYMIYVNGLTKTLGSNEY